MDNGEYPTPDELAEVLGNTSIDHLHDSPFHQWEHVVNELAREGYVIVRASEETR